MRHVRTDASIKRRGDYVFIGEPLCGELVALSELETGDHVTRFAGRDLGVLERAGRFRRFAAPRKRLRETPKTGKS